MHGVAQLEHHVVGGIDHVVDGLLSHGPQSPGKPLRRWGHLYSADDHTEESVTELRLVDADADLGVRHLQLARLDLEIEIRGARDGR